MSSFVCKKHGQFEAEPNLNFDIFCPKCYNDNEAFLDRAVNKAIELYEAEKDPAKEIIRARENAAILRRLHEDRARAALRLSHLRFKG